MEDNITVEKDKLLAEAQRLELKGNCDKEAIAKYEEAYNLGAKEASLRIACRYLWSAVLPKANKEYAKQAYEWFQIAYPHNKLQAINGLLILSEKYYNDGLGQEVLQFIIKVAKQGDEYARVQFENIKEKIK